VRGYSAKIIPRMPASMRSVLGSLAVLDQGCGLTLSEMGAAWAANMWWDCCGFTFRLVLSSGNCEMR